MSTTIVMTGGSSGLGAIAAERWTRAGARVIVGARGPSPGGESLPLELSALQSVRSFAASVRERLGRTRIDALVLNAGVIRHDGSGRTADGLETTFAINHLAHYLLLRLLMPALCDGARVVLTTSGTHDPATRAGLATPRHADVDLLAHPDRDPEREADSHAAGEHAYTASKLCALLVARWLAARQVDAIAYCPGQVFGTGLADDLSLPMRIAWHVLGTRVGAPLRLVDRNINSRVVAGRALGMLGSRVVTPPPGRVYAALRRGQLTWPDPSDLAGDDALAEALWRDSAKLVGM